MLQQLATRPLRLHRSMAAGLQRNPSCPAATARALEHVLHCFIAGYNLALTSRSNASLAQSLNDGFDAHHLGFAYEGAGLALALLDLVSLNRRQRLLRFITEEAAPHDYIVMVGAGFAPARIPAAAVFWRRYFSAFNPLVSWCVPDGAGFHQGAFHPGAFIDSRQPAPTSMSENEAQLFDSGIGRSLWWSTGADPTRIALTISTFNPARRPELWCGIGVACAYAGSGDAQALPQLLELAASYRAHFLSGIPFAARMRQKGNNPSPVTTHACRVLLALTPDQAAAIAHNELFAAEQTLGPRVGSEGYALIRQRIAQQFTEKYAEPPSRKSTGHSIPRHLSIAI